MGITKEVFGRTKDGHTAYLYTLTNENGMKVVVSDFGATLVSVYVPNRAGGLTDVVLGHDKVEDYEKSTVFFGATVGRNANRIGGAEFCLDGKTYPLAANDGANNLHSNPNGYHIRIWEVNQGDNELGESISFSLFSPDGDQGYPGNLNVTVSYILTPENALMLHYKAAGDQNTIVNMTNHSYFNLAGHDSGTAMNQKVWINADQFTEADEASIPTGKLISVENTPMDFRGNAVIGARIDEDYEALNFGGGYDHNWVLNNNGQYELAAKMSDETSGIEMKVYTDLPGMQFYTGNFLDKEPGKNGAVYEKRAGVCFETQYFPDAIHHPEFVSPVLKASDEYETTTVYEFSLLD